MGFTTPCFIRKNTPELQDKLKKLGIVEHPSCIESFNDYLYVGRGFYNTLPIGYSEEIENAIDCGTNEELFISIAALRDDTNENQWFTNGEEWAYHPKTECCSPCNTVYRTLAFDYIPKDTNMVNYHKATVKELIEHFKEKEE